MPPIDIGRTEAIRAVSTPIARNGTAAADAGQSPVARAATPTTNPAAAFDPGEAPVDVQRVQDIRKAVESGTYPLVPAKIADAMIAAGVMLRSPKA